MFLKYLYDKSLAHASYIVGCQKSGEAIVIDPSRSVDQYLDAAAVEGLRIVGSAETHIHADFVSGSRELADRIGAKLYLSDEGPADWKYQFADQHDSQLLKDRDVFYVGKVKFEVLHTPGHTEDHLAVWIPELRVLLAGDAAEYPFPHVVGAASLVTLRASLTRLSELGAEVVLACHGQTTRPDLPALNLAYFSRLEAEVREVLNNSPVAGSVEGDGLASAVTSRFSYADALRWLGATDAAPFYRRFHDDAVHAMTELLRPASRDKALEL